MMNMFFNVKIIQEALLVLRKQISMEPKKKSSDYTLLSRFVYFFIFKA